MGDVSSSSFFNRRNKIRYIISDDFENSPVSFEAEIVSDDLSAFTTFERREIERALFNKPDYRKLYIDVEDDTENNTCELVDGNIKRLYLNCRFVNPSKIEDGSGLVIGYGFTVECDSCMAWQEAIEKTYTFSNGNRIISVETNTDIGGYTYPEVTVNIGSAGGDIIIINSTDDASRFTKFTSLSESISLIMKGDTNYVSGQNYEKFANQNFIRLLNGTNTINITGDVTSIKFKWQNRRFL